MTDTPRPIISLLTDFGVSGSYVGAMKGVLLGIVPDAHLVDISHQVAAQDVHEAALIIASVYQYFPAHTVHLIVIDPGVGGTRRPIAVQTPHGYFVAPDNGVLTYVLLKEPEFMAVALENPAYQRPNPSYTFHGRDIFSPSAAHLASGVKLESLGPVIHDLERLALPKLRVMPGHIQGEVVHIDRFGNILTNIMQLQWVSEEMLKLEPLGPHEADATPVEFSCLTAEITLGWRNIKGIYHTYSEVPVGHSLALIGSNGELEVAVNQGSASAQLAVQVGDPVSLRLGPPL